MNDWIAVSIYASATVVAVLLLIVLVVQGIRIAIVSKIRQRRIDECAAEAKARINARHVHWMGPWEDFDRGQTFERMVNDLHKWAYADFYGDGSFKD